jgi:methionine sulfoxide reductase heme-binding subunit
VILHYWWHKAGKNDLQAVSIYAGTIIFLLTLRLPFIKQRFLRK